MRKRILLIWRKEAELRPFIGVLALLVIFFTVLAGAYFLGPVITGLIVGTEQFSYSDKINMEFNESSEFEWSLENRGRLKAIKLSGIIENQGSARIYVVNKNSSYLIFDSNKLSDKEILDKITGYAAAENEEDAEANESNNPGKGKEPNHPPVWNSATDTFAINETLILDLNDYFEDKDGDTLAFSASELNTDDLEISLEGLILMISNKNNIEGDRTMHITASDNETSKKKGVTLILVKIANETAIPDATNGTSNTTAILNETTDNITAEKAIDINLEYEVGTNYDVDDNGIETTTGIVDLTVKGARFNWDADEKNLCTRWETYSVENEESTFVCYGSQDCCALSDLKPARENWDETFHSYYGLYGATENNIVGAQVIYADYNLSLEKPYAEIANSAFANLSVSFYMGLIAFNDICIDTCALFGFNGTSYKLIIELNDTKLSLNEIAYVIEKEALINNEPELIKNISNITIAKNHDYAINLTEYFYDENNDNLSYGYFDAGNITIKFEGDLAHIIPGENFTGNIFTFITANDSLETAASNVFKVEVLDADFSATLEIRNLEDDKLAMFDGLGNLRVKGTFIQNTTLQRDNNDFAIESSNGSVNMIVKNPEGDMLIKEFLNENQSLLEPTPDSFVVMHDKTGEILAYLNSTGSLFLRLSLMQNVLLE